MGLYVSPIQCICITSQIYITITSHPFMHAYIQYEYFIIEKLQLYGRLIAGTCTRDLPPFFYLLLYELNLLNIVSNIAECKANTIDWSMC